MSEILITNGSSGSTIYNNGHVTKIAPVAPKEAIDATGCGDAYIAGYLAKRLSGCDSIESANFASEIATKNIEVRGALGK